MPRPLLKYQIGLGAIGLFVIVLLIIILVQAGATKQDNVTYNQATKIANQVNYYVNNQGSIPQSLAAAGAYHVPDSITYKVLSASSYQFCVNYKATSSGFSAAGIEGQLISSATGQPSYYGDGYGGTTDDSTLYIDPTHHKGENCQVVKPYSYNYDNNTTNSSTD